MDNLNKGKKVALSVSLKPENHFLKTFRGSGRVINLVLGLVFADCPDELSKIKRAADIYSGAYVPAIGVEAVRTFDQTSRDNTVGGDSENGKNRTLSPIEHNNSSSKHGKRMRGDFEPPVNERQEPDIDKICQEEDHHEYKQEYASWPKGS